MTLKEKFENIEHLGFYKDEYSLPVWSTKVLDNQTSQCEKIADEFAAEFAEWCAFYIYKSRNVIGDMLHAKSKYDDMYTSKELLEIFKKEKGL